jgi:DNA repair protein RadD
MRIHNDKKNCLVLDYAGNCLRHGPIDAINPEKKTGDGDGVAPVKECPECHEYIACGCRVCPACGYEFPPPAPQIEKKNIEAPILKSQIAPIKLEVTNVLYTKHKKLGSNDSVKITYFTHSIIVNEWVFPEFNNQRQAYFFSVFCKPFGWNDLPNSVDDFLARDKKDIAFIHVQKDGQYYKVVNREYYADDVPF